MVGLRGVPLDLALRILGKLQVSAARNVAILKALSAPALSKDAGLLVRTRQFLERNKSTPLDRLEAVGFIDAHASLFGWTPDDDEVSA